MFNYALTVALISLPFLLPLLLSPSVLFSLLHLLPSAAVVYPPLLPCKSEWVVWQNEQVNEWTWLSERVHPEHPSIMHPGQSLSWIWIFPAYGKIQQTSIMHPTCIRQTSSMYPKLHPAYISMHPAYINIHPACIQHTSSMHPTCTLCSSSGEGCDRVLSPTNPGFNVKCQMSCSPQQVLCSSTAPAIMWSIRSLQGFDCHQHPPFRIPSTVFIIFMVHPNSVCAQWDLWMTKAGKQIQLRLKVSPQSIYRIYRAINTHTHTHILDWRPFWVYVVVFRTLNKRAGNNLSGGIHKHQFIITGEENLAFISFIEGMNS